MLAGREGASDRAWPPPWQVLEHARELGEDPPVRPSVSDEQDEGLGRVIAPLEIDPTTGCLNIAETHLELD